MYGTVRRGLRLEPRDLGRASGGRHRGRWPLCIDCPCHAAHDCRRRRIPGSARVPGALLGPLRRAGPRTGAVRRRSRPPRRHQRRAAPPSQRRPPRRTQLRRRLPPSAPPRRLAEALTERTWCSRRSGPAGQPAASPMSGSPRTWGSWARKPPGQAASPTRCGPSPPCWSSRPDAAPLPRRVAARTSPTRPAWSPRRWCPVLGRKVIGICDSASALVHRAARAAGVAAARRKARRRGLLRPEPSRLAVPARVRRPRRRFRTCWRTPAPWPVSRRAGCFRSPSWPELGSCPTNTCSTTTRPSPPWPGMRAPRTTRGESIDRQQSELYPRLAAAGRRPTGCGTPHAVPARRATSPRPVPRGERRDEAGPGRRRLRARRARRDAGALRRRCRRS